MAMAKMQHQPWLLGTLLMIFLLQIPRGTCDVSNGTADGTEEWGYTDVREGAHLFWWLYYNDLSAPAEIPLVLWLQGGPGSSGVGYGNFGEIGPLHVNLTKREYNWLQLAHLLFVDNPVGVGYSYVDDPSLLTTTNKQISDDLIEFFKVFFSTHENLTKSPFYIFAESYGGKYATEVGVAICKAVAEGVFDVNFKGVGLGDTWISPFDMAAAWGPLLKSVSVIDDVQNDYLNSIVEQIEDAMAEGRYYNATTHEQFLEEAIINITDVVDFYNFLIHGTEAYSSAGVGGLGARHLARLAAPDPLTTLMNGPIREKLGIIPSSVIWGETNQTVFDALWADVMLPKIDKVDELLELGINVTIYSGQLDLIGCTTGTEAWLKKLKWPGLASFNAAKRTPLYCGVNQIQTQAFVKKYENLAFYWILNAGHMVPADNPCEALYVLSQVISTNATILISS